MSKPKLIFAVSLEPDFSCEPGEAEPYRVNVPALDFNELAVLLEREVKSGDKVSVRCANDYLDIVTLHGAEGMLDQLSLYCKHTVGEACSKPGKSKAIEISALWAEKFPVQDRAEAAPPGILFFTVTGSSIVSLGVWITVLHNCFGRHRTAEPDVENQPMSPQLQAGFENFFGMPFRPVAVVTNLGPVE